MSIEDRDYYRERYAKREGMRYNKTKGTYSSAQDWYDPKQYRSSRRNFEGEPEASHTFGKPPSRPRVVQNLAASGPPDLPGAHLPLLVRVFLIAGLAFMAYSVLNDFSSRRQRSAVTPTSQQIAAPTPAPVYEPVPSSVPRDVRFDPEMQDKIERRMLEDLRAEKLRAAEAAKAQKREAQWKRFFQPSAICRSEPTRVECANEFIRARRAFEAANG